MRRGYVWLTVPLIVGAVAAPLAAEMLDQMIAVVNDEVITQRDFDEAIRPYREQLEAQYEGPELEERLREAMREVFNTLIDDRLVLSEAKQLGLTATDEEVEERLADVRQQFDSAKAFEVAMATEGVGMERLRQIYRSQVLTRKVSDIRVRSRVTVQPAEIATYYQEHREQFRQPPQMHVSNILIRIGEGLDAAAARERAEEVLRRLQAGESFADLARQYSQGAGADTGGDLGWVEVGHMRPEFEAALALVEPEGYTPIIETEVGFYIFALHERRTEAVSTLEQVQQQIEYLLKRRRFEQLLKEWLAELRSKAYIATPGLEGLLEQPAAAQPDRPSLSGVAEELAQ